MNGAQRDTIEEIKKLVQEESIDLDAALRLTLSSQLIVTSELVEIKQQTLRIEERAEKRMTVLENGVDEKIEELETYKASLRECITNRVGILETYHKDYPSLVWFWIHRRKSLILMLLVIMLMYTVLFGWVNISDIRQAILHQMGLPPDLGSGPPTTPTPMP